MKGRSIVFASVATAAACLAASAAGGAGPLIGRPAPSPRRPQAGSTFKVTFHVAHASRAAFNVTLGGARQRHSDSFRGGVARTSMVLPITAAGKALSIQLTARSGSTSTSKRVTYVVLAAPPPAMSIQDASVPEGSGGAVLTFQVSLTHAASKAVTVNYATADGTATAPSDYNATNGTLTFTPGQTTKGITVPVVGDQIKEPDETMTVTLSGAVNATLGKATATGTITNDDTAAPVSAGSWKGATQEGNSVFFTVTGDRQITGFRTNSITENCNNNVYLQGSVDWGTQTFPIADDATFLAQYSWTGSQTINGVEYTAETWKLTGTFATATTIGGTIALTDELNYQGTHYSCAGSVTFTAAFQG